MTSTKKAPGVRAGPAVTSTQKNSPGGKAGARKTDSHSDQEPPQGSLKKRQGPGASLPQKFWLKTDDATGEELAFERKPDLPHLTVDVDDGFERTRTATLRVRDAFTRQGWELELEGEWRQPFSSANWRRPLSSDWQKLRREEAKKAYPGLGRVWRRPGIKKGGES